MLWLTERQQRETKNGIFCTHPAEMENVGEIHAREK